MPEMYLKEFKTKINMSNLVKSIDIPGPSISGQVTVPLAELDKMRLDHAKLKQLCEHLESTAMSVKVVVVEEKWGYKTEPRTDSRGRQYNATVNGKDYVTISTDYKNLDDVKAVLKQELLDEGLLKTQQLNKELLEVKQKLSDKITEYSALQIESGLATVNLGKANEKIEKLEQSLASEVEAKNKLLEADAISFAKITELHKIIAERNAELILERNKKGFWGFLYK